eukprot:9027054-Ditylum_brightwellii.AAC.1
MMFTFLGNGTMSPIYVTSSERNCDPTCQKAGYLVLFQKDATIESVHLHNNEHYHKEVYHPMMNKVYSDLYGYDEDEYGEIPDELTSVG